MTYVSYFLYGIEVEAAFHTVNAAIKFIERRKDNEFYTDFFIFHGKFKRPNLSTSGRVNGFIEE